MQGLVTSNFDCAVDQAASPGSHPCRYVWDLWWTKFRIGFSPTPLVSSCQYHFTSALYSLVYHLENR